MSKLTDRLRNVGNLSLVVAACASGIAALLQFIVTRLLSFHLAPEEFGRWVLIASIGGFVGLVGDGAVGVVLIRRLPGVDSSVGASMIKVTRIITAAGALCLSLLLVALSGKALTFSGGSLKSTDMLGAGIGGAVGLLVSQELVILTAMGDRFRWSAANAVRAFISATVAIAAAWMGTTPTVIYVVTVASALLVTIWFARSAQRKFLDSHTENEVTTATPIQLLVVAKEFLREGAWINTSQLFGAGSVIAIPLILGRVMGPSFVGAYRVRTLLGAGITAVAASFYASMIYPEMTRANAGTQPGGMTAHNGSASKAASFALFTVAITLILLSSIPFLASLFGGTQGSGWRMLLAADLARICGWFVSYRLVAGGHRRRFLANEISAGVTMIGILVLATRNAQVVTFDVVAGSLLVASCVGPLIAFGLFKSIVGTDIGESVRLLSRGALSVGLVFLFAARPIGWAMVGALALFFVWSPVTLGGGTPSWSWKALRFRWQASHLK